MNNKERLFAYGIILLLASIMVYFIFIEKPSYVDEYNKKIELLRLKNDSIVGVNNGLTLEVTFIYKKIDTLNSKIISKDEEIIKLKKSTHEQVNNVDSLTDDELQLFFTNRYGPSTIKPRDSSRSN